MSWSCGACRRVHKDPAVDDDERILVDAVCHHCGKPLCTWEPDEDDSEGGPCQNWIFDDAFTAEGDEPVAACHCRDCLGAQHPTARTIARPHLSQPVRPAT